MPKKAGGANKLSKNEKFKQKIKTMIEKTKLLQQRRQHQADLLKVQQEKLQSLLDGSSKIDGNTLKNEIKSIAKGYKDSTKAYKKQRKERLKKQRQQRKKEKAEIKRRKQEYLTAINRARINKLPQNKEEINNSNVLNIYIDGWNIISCDKLCRKQMRKNRLNAISRFIRLIKMNFIDNKDVLNLPYQVNIYCLFDGNGSNELNEGINIEFTGKESVDNKLINTFNKIENKDDNKCNLIITSDRELTYKLYQTGVKVMTSSAFYKTYLREDVIGNELAKTIAMKMNLHSDDEQDQNDNNNPDIMDNHNDNHNHNHNKINNPTDVMDEDNEELEFTFDDDNESDDEAFDENMDDINNE